MGLKLSEHAKKQAREIRAQKALDQLLRQAEKDKGEAVKAAAMAKRYFGEEWPIDVGAGGGMVDVGDLRLRKKPSVAYALQVLIDGEWQGWICNMEQLGHELLKAEEKKRQRERCKREKAELIAERGLLEHMAFTLDEILEKMK